jgi:hypothetical protein
MQMQIRALWQLARFEYYFARGDFAQVYRTVKEFPCSKVCSPLEMAGSICEVLDQVVIWYPKRVLCLHRSAASTCLLRQYGIPARMILGAQSLPFKAHAWVEVSGRAVNDKLYMNEMYAVLDCC